MIEIDAISYERGRSDARREIAAGHLRLFSGAPSETEWGRHLEEMLRSCFGVTVVFTSCFVTVQCVSYEAGFNAAITEHVGEPRMDEVFAKVGEFRTLRYKEVFGTEQS